MYISPLLLICSAILLFILAISWARNTEKRRFNNGICLKCGTNLQLSLGMRRGLLKDTRGWVCPKCSYTIWVSYDIDMDYRKKQRETSM